jgi:hypothetical protein
MKLRVQGSSIRFRITQSEVASLAAGARLEDSTQFGPAPSEILTYAVEVSSQCSKVRASYSKGVIQVTLPANLAQAWVRTNQVGIEYAQPLGNAAFLKIAVEKDFRCFHPGRGENERDNFPNPNDPSGPGSSH